ncbi:MAG: gamma-glutamyltransferase [Cyclobacteriaceae bacterium]|nr:gamma-glutamyltransferase [Cyclobacteriaceae bacterium]
MVKKLIVGFFLLFALFFAISCGESKSDFLGVVSTASPEASKVGESILQKGGNAVDAAVAISFALGVTEPAMSGLGGGTQVLLSLKNQAPIAINGTTLSPAGTPTTILDTLSYHRRSTIPSTVKVLGYIWKKYGSGNMSWSDLLQPAIILAEDGFKVGKFRVKIFEQYSDKLNASPHNTYFFMDENRSIPGVGKTLKQPQLAKTLKRLAATGADDFYKGEIAAKISQDMEENNGWITIEDLNNFPEPKELAPLEIEYNGYQIYSQPPPCGGWPTLLLLKLLSNLDSNNEISENDIVEALYLGHKDRREKPVVNLSEYQQFTNTKLSDDYAKDLVLQAVNSYSLEQEEEENGETTHFSVVDHDGNGIAVTSSINAYFGALATSEELGFLYNTYMDDFIFEQPAHPFAVRPHAMAYSSMSPTIVRKDGEIVLVLGSPGSGRIISSVAQFTAKWIENHNIEELIKYPRIHVDGNTIYLENSADSAVITKELLDKYELEFEFKDESLSITPGLNSYFGGIHAIAKENGNWVGVADPRRDGLPIIVREKD